jgi:hypothetical protein
VIKLILIFSFIFHRHSEDPTASLHENPSKSLLQTEKIVPRLSTKPSYLSQISNHTTPVENDTMNGNIEKFLPHNSQNSKQNIQKTLKKFNQLMRTGWFSSCSLSRSLSLCLCLCLSLSLSLSVCLSVCLSLSLSFLSVSLCFSLSLYLLLLIGSRNPKLQNLVREYHRKRFLNKSASQEREGKD